MRLSAVGATRRPYLLRFVCDLYRGSKSTRPSWESSTNRYRTDGILSPVSLAISLYRAPFLYMLTIMFVLPLQSILHEDDFSWLRRGPPTLRTEQPGRVDRQGAAFLGTGKGRLPLGGGRLSLGFRLLPSAGPRSFFRSPANRTTASSIRYWVEGEGQGRERVSAILLSCARLDHPRARPGRARGSSELASVWRAGRAGVLSPKAQWMTASRKKRS
jgi:hypothetical protein